MAEYADGTGRSFYSKGAMFFHWTIAALIILNLIIGFFHEGMAPAARGFAMSVHKSTGILVIALTLGRIAWRFTHRPPPLPVTVKSWEKGLAHAVHWTLYALMLALPLTGWLMSSAGKRKNVLDFYGLFQVPYLPVAQEEAAAHTYAERHEQLAYIMLALLVLHLAGAAKHYFMDRDRTVHRMLPVLKDRSPA
ncbi:MAG TPA: cytochrome b [Sphingomonas sp.]|nr:cytochrome b [Sphingomonas sp.]